MLRSLQRNYVLFSSPFLALRSTTVIISSFTLTPEVPCRPLVAFIHFLSSVNATFLSDFHAHRKFVSFCWIPSYFGLFGNQKADILAKRAIQLPPANHNALLLQEYVPSSPFHPCLLAFLLGLVCSVVLSGVTAWKFPCPVSVSVILVLHTVI